MHIDLRHVHAKCECIYFRNGETMTNYQKSQRRSSGARGDRVEIEEIEYIVFTLCTTNIFFVLK